MTHPITVSLIRQFFLHEANYVLLFQLTSTMPMSLLGTCFALPLEWYAGRLLMRCSSLSGCCCLKAAFSTDVPPVRPLRWTKMALTQNFIGALQKCFAEYGLELLLNTLQLHVTLLEHFTLKGFTSQHYNCEVLIQSTDVKLHTFLTICHYFFTHDYYLTNTAVTIDWLLLISYYILYYSTTSLLMLVLLLSKYTLEFLFFARPSWFTPNRVPF